MTARCVSVPPTQDGPRRKSFASTTDLAHGPALSVRILSPSRPRILLRHLRSLTMALSTGKHQYGQPNGPDGKPRVISRRRRDGYRSPETIAKINDTRVQNGVENTRQDFRKPSRQVKWDRKRGHKGAGMGSLRRYWSSEEVLCKHFSSGGVRWVIGTFWRMG